MSALYRAYVRDEVLGPVGLPVDDDALASEVPPLDTALHLPAAIALYRAAGYQEIPAFNSGPLADLWFERELP